MADAGIGIILSDRPPYTILHFNPNGPAAEAARQGLVQLNDAIDQINNVSVGKLDKLQVDSFIFSTAWTGKKVEGSQAERVFSHPN